MKFVKFCNDGLVEVKSMNEKEFAILYLPIICNRVKEEKHTSEEENLILLAEIKECIEDPILLAKAEKCIELVKNFDVDLEDDKLIEEIASNLMYCPDEYLDKMLKVFN